MATSAINPLATFNKNGSTALKAGGTSVHNYSSVNSIDYNSSGLDNVSGVKEGLDVGKTSDSLEFAWNNPRPLVKGYTTAINTSVGTSGKELGSTGSHSTDLIRSSHPSESTRTRLVATAIRDGFYNPYSGEFDLGYPDNQLDDFGYDYAAVANRNSQASLFFSTGSETFSRPYDKKTG